MKNKYTARGTNVSIGNEKRDYCNEVISLLKSENYTEIYLPSIEMLSLYKKATGDEIESQMYSFKDKKGRDLCLRPECTKTVHSFKNELPKDTRLFYLQKCWRYERPQKGRYREFLQLGVEIINPTKNYLDEMIDIATQAVELRTFDYVLNKEVTRALSYYTEKGFEITCDELGAQKQVCGGGTYKDGIGFALGIERLMLLTKK